MDFSDFGKRFAGQIGIGELMDDLGDALVSDPAPLMLGGGNPAHVPEVQALFRSRMKDILSSAGEFERVIGNYDTPQGAKAFVRALADLFRDEFGWDIGPANIALTNGSQNAFFSLFNLFAGKFDGGHSKQILLPLAPEYIGYSEVGLEPNFFQANRPEIELLDDRLFKYRVDFDRLKMDESIGAICFSRPTNPTGNVVTDDEVSRLRELANLQGIPLIIDNAYGTPFPNIIYTDAQPVWDENIVLCLSLSKFGLPSLRTGVVIAREEVIRIVSRMTSVFSLAPGSLGPALALDLVNSGEITRVSNEVVKPFYEEKAKRAVAQLRQEIGDHIPMRIHKPEGALFLWLWFEGLPISSQELYQRLKKKGVLVVSGDYFFPGMEEDNWVHKNECIRVTYAQDDVVVTRGIQLLSEEIKEAFSR
ncbi:MAG: valine--pyruvate transaminase [Verrucomicrobia bacterium TMED56]|nr:MAG: valine--pyruvate transaminase [Verrucomicrobia bacterium TMED56]